MKEKNNSDDFNEIQKFFMRFGQTFCHIVSIVSAFLLIITLFAVFIVFAVGFIEKIYWVVSGIILILIFGFVGAEATIAQREIERRRHIRR